MLPANRSTITTTLSRNKFTAATTIKVNSFKRNLHFFFLLHLWFISHEHDDRYMSVCFPFFSSSLSSSSSLFCRLFFRTFFFDECHLRCIGIVLGLLRFDHFSFRLKIFSKFISVKRIHRSNGNRARMEEKNDRKQFETKANTKLKVNQKSVFLSTKCNELLRLYLYLPIQIKYSHYFILFFWFVCVFFVSHLFCLFLAIIIDGR